MPDPFNSPRRRIAAAKQQICNLDQRLAKFFEKRRYRMVIEEAADGTHDVHKIKLTKLLPDSLGDLANNAIENLRSALDQAAFATTGRENAKSAYFPVGDDISGLENVIKGRCKDIPSEIVALFRSFQPYRGRNDAIWTLNRLCNVSKHRLLIPIGTAGGAIKVGGGVLIEASGAGGIAFGPQPWDSEKNEMIYAIVGRSSKLTYDVKVGFFVAFGEVESIDRKPITPLLNAFTKEVGASFPPLRRSASVWASRESSPRHLTVFAFAIRRLRLPRL